MLIEQRFQRGLRFSPRTTGMREQGKFETLTIHRLHFQQWFPPFGHDRFRLS